MRALHDSSPPLRYPPPTVCPSLLGREDQSAFQRFSRQIVDSTSPIAASLDDSEDDDEELIDLEEEGLGSQPFAHTVLDGKLYFTAFQTETGQYFFIILSSF